MLTTESKFSEFVKLFVEAGACADAKAYTDSILKEDETLEETISKYEKEPNKNDAFVAWFISRFGQEIESKLRLRYIKTITNPMIALKLMHQLFLTVDEMTFLKSATENPTEIQKLVDSISDPMEAARMLIDNPKVTDAQEMILRSKFVGQLPTIEKELATGIVTTAKAKAIEAEKGGGNAF